MIHLLILTKYLHTHTDTHTWVILPNFSSDTTVWLNKTELLILWAGVAPWFLCFSRCFYTRGQIHSDDDDATTTTATAEAAASVDLQNILLSQIQGQSCQSVSKSGS